MVKTEYTHRLPASKGRQRTNLRDIDIREFIKSPPIRNKQYISLGDAEVIQAEQDKGLSVASYFGQWIFHKDGGISILPDMEWITPVEIRQSENVTKGRMGKPRQKYQPRKCDKCGKYWTNYCGAENHSKVIKKEYLSNEIFGGLPMEKETCWKCDDV